MGGAIVLEGGRKGVGLFLSLLSPSRTGAPAGAPLGQLPLSLAPAGTSIPSKSLSPTSSSINPSWIIKE